MFFNISISWTIAIVGLVIVRGWCDCFEKIPWTFILTLLAVSCFTTILAHIYGWKCWHFLWQRPQRLYSMTNVTVQKRKDIVPQIVLYIWVTVLWLASFLLHKCQIKWWWAAIATSVLVLYTAFSCSRTSSSSEEEASSVKASELSSNSPSSENVSDNSTTVLTSGMSSSSPESVSPEPQGSVTPKVP